MLFQASTVKQRDYKDSTDLVLVPDICIPINDKATRCNNGGDTRNNDGAGNGLGVGKDGDPSPTLTRGDRHAICFEPGILKREGGHIYDEISGTIRSNPGDNNMSVAYNKPKVFKETADCLTASYGTKWNGNASAENGSLFYQHYNSIVRRLTPLEGERLQGFPDNYTKIPWRNKPIEDCPDGPRYKAIGNSMAVPVMKWIGQRIDAVDKILKK